MWGEIQRAIALIAGIGLIGVSLGGNGQGAVRITEIAAVDQEVLADGDGDYPDWIELYNPGPETVNLEGYFLTDRPDWLQKWRFPSVEIPAGGYLIVFASGKDKKDSAGFWHTNFRLDGAGEYLALVAPDGQTVRLALDPKFPKQRAGMSYGEVPGEPGHFVYWEQPTPGRVNSGPWYEGLVGDTHFSVDRGFYDTPFDLELSCETPGAKIYYTLDGSEPTPQNGILYTGPIHITTTTVVRVRAYKEGWLPFNVDTQTYLFLQDVIHQPADPPGFPAYWADVRADYEMDPRIVEDPRYKDRIVEGLRSLPSVCINTSKENLFDPQTGIYANPERHGVEWERPCSVEWIDPETGETFQVDCGLRIQGGYFRKRTATRKHSFRLLFKERYGPAKLHFRLFPYDPDAAEEFDTLVLRAGANDGYAWEAAKDTEQYTRDEFGRRLMLAMGHPAPHGRFVHLYIDGLYWGLYNLVERPNEDFSATYLGGRPEDWDAISNGEVKNGDLQAWNTLVSMVKNVHSLADFYRILGCNPDGTRNPEYPVYLNLTNYLDYMILNMWGGNWDWPGKNYWIGRKRTPDSQGFYFYVWDFENTMGNNRSRSPLNMVAPRPGTENRGVGVIHYYLKHFSEYRLAFADRVRRWFFHGGVLTPDFLIPCYKALADRIETAMIAESARWGDDHWDPPQDLEDWLRERDWILNTYLPQRTQIVLEQFREAGLYPPVEAPEVEPYGGPIRSTDPVILSVTARELYYTLDGIDPRLPGGNPNPHATHVVFTNSATQPPKVLITTGWIWKYLDDGTDPGPNWMQPDFDDSHWKSGPSQLGYGDRDEATVVGYVDFNPNQPGVQKNPTTYFRTELTLEDPSVYESFDLKAVHDDAVAVYINGQEVLRTENLPPDAGYDTYATGQHPDNAVAWVRDLPPSLFRKGRNVIAAEVHQRSPSSSDISFDLTLIGKAPPPKPNQVGPLYFTNAVVLKARAYDNGEWSALTEVHFQVDVVPPRPGDLIVSEIHYRPAEPKRPEEMAISQNRDEFEFLELYNASTNDLDLSGVRFVQGITFVFPEGTRLPAGGYLVLAKNPEAFRARYPNAPVPLGPYDGNLSNTGEELVLQAADDTVLLQFRYNDKAPWPKEADGEGYSLVLKRPEIHPDPNDPRNWRGSVEIGGSPGRAEGRRFHGDSQMDADQNGRPDWVDQALRDADGHDLPGLRLEWETDKQGVPHLVLVVQRFVGADDVEVELEQADSLSGPWEPLDPGQWDVESRRVAGGILQTEWRSVGEGFERKGRFYRLYFRLIRP